MASHDGTAELFSSTTQFHGLAHSVGVGKKSKFVWLILTLLSAAFCANDFVHLVIMYLSEPTNININIKANQEIPFKTPTLCMEFKQALYNSNDNWVRIESMSAEFDKIINMTRGFKVPVNSINADALTYAYLMLGTITKAELYHTGRTNYRLDVFKAGLTVPPNLGTNLRWLFRYFTHRRVSFGTLKRVVAGAICSQHFTQFLQYQHPADPHPQILPLCKPEMITYMGYSLICTKMFLTDTVPINSSDRYRKFAITATKQFLNLTDFYNFDQCHINIEEPDSAYIPGYFVKFLWYVDFEGRPSMPTGIRTNIFSWDPQKLIKVDVAVDRRVQLYNRNSQKCSEANDQYSCEWQNRAARMAQSCSCWPSTLMHISKGVGTNWPDCYTTISPTTILTDNFTYPQCKGQNLSYLSGVENICLPNCIQISYGASRHNLGTVLDENNLFEYGIVGYFEIQFQTGGNCLEITESPATSWSTFVWTFGGSMGTWLGGSILAFIHIPFYIGNRLASELIRRRKLLLSVVKPEHIDMYGRTKKY